MEKDRQDKLAKFSKSIKKLIEEKPVELSDIQKNVGKEFGFSRRQTETRVINTVAKDNDIKMRKPDSETASRIFYRSDYRDGSEGE